MTSPRHWVIIPAAGVGARMRADRPKQYLPLLGRTVIEHTLACFSAHPAITGIVVALSEGDPYWGGLHLPAAMPIHVARGGAERCHSVLNALHHLAALAAEQDWVLVHDAARPCLRREDIDRLLTSLVDDPVGGILAVPVRDTMKRSDGEGRIRATEERAGLWHALTPQMFRLGGLTRALEQALAGGFLVTDEASAVEHAGLRPRLIEGHADNIKVTRPEDLALAQFFLSTRGEPCA